MRLSLRPAVDKDQQFCEHLHRANMDAYWMARGIAWDPQRFVDSWRTFENHIILRDDDAVGVLQLLGVSGALEIRDLQLLAAYQGQGIGSWAIQQAKRFARQRDLAELRLRVLVENPAQHLYARLGFRTTADENGILHMTQLVSK